MHIDKSQKSAAQVTRAKVKQVKLGMRKSVVRGILGKPEKTDSQEIGGTKMGCWYYGVLADTTWQFCFTNGKLDSKNRY